MALEWTDTQAIAVRMVNQGLADRSAADPRAAALRCNGIQAQDLWASQLAVRARSATASVGDVVTAAAAPSVVRTWLMRGTLHMVAADDLRWLVALIGPTVLKAAEPRFLEVGLTPSVRDRVRTVLPELLTGRTMTRAELRTALAARVPDLPTPGQGPAHLTVWASACGLICRAGDRGKEPTYALVEEFVPLAPAPDEPLRELVRRYVAAFGPVTVEDFTSWSRLPVTPTRRAFSALSEELQTVSVHGRPHHLLDEVKPARRVLRLLPAFDSYLMGYRGRDAFLAPARRGEVAVGGILHPTIVVDGRIVGTWRLDRSRDPMRLRAMFFDRPPSWQDDALRAEVADVARFLDRSAELTVGNGPPPQR